MEGDGCQLVNDDTVEEIAAMASDSMVQLSPEEAAQLLAEADATWVAGQDRS